MRKLRQFQDLGHEVTFLIGSYTSLIGDPSDKDKLRPQLSLEQVEENGRTYAQQSFKILDPDRTTIRYNREWLEKLTFAQLIQLAGNFTLQQFLTRDNFKQRWEKGDPVYLHETFYALMQGYDAWALQADVQVGGTDQLYNIVTAARKIMPILGLKPNIGIILGILPGTDGRIKMSKSLGNHIPLNSTPEDMYGKVMSVPDFAMGSFFRLVTRWSPAEIRAIEAGIQDQKVHPRDAKMRLAWEIVSSLFGEGSAQSAEAAFIRTFQQQAVPDQIPEYCLQPGQTVIDVLVAAGLASSRGEARRLVAQKGVRLDGQVVEDAQAKLIQPGVLQAGKRKTVRIVC